MNHIKFIRDKLTQKYEKIKRDNTSEVKIETEFRFTLFSKPRKGYFTPSSGVDVATYLRIKNHYTKRELKSSSSLTTDYAQNVGNFRIRKTIENDGGVSWLKKGRNYLNYLSDDYYVQIAINTEKDITEEMKNDDSLFKPDNIRIKDRTSFVFNNGQTYFGRLDITYVESDITKLESEFRKQNMTEDEIKDKLSSSRYSSYEIEFEILDYSDWNSLDSELNELYKIVHDTHRIYNQKQYETIVSYINKTINPGMWGGKAKRLIGTNNFLKARNLNYKDIVWGGLIGNEKYHYRITIKADGYRKILVFHQSGIWIVGGESEVNLVHPNQIELLNGYILEGELIPVKKRREISTKSKFLFYVFDVLATKPHNRKLLKDDSGDTSIQNEHHNIRMKHVYDIILKSYQTNQLLAIYGKKFYDFYASSELFNIIRELDPMTKV